MLCMFVGVGNAWADTTGSATLVWSDKGLENSTSVDGTSYDVGDYFTVTCTKNNASTLPAYYTSGTAVRCYVTKSTNNGNIITIARKSGAPSNVYITKVTYTGEHSKKGTTSFSYSGSPSESDATSATYNASDEVTTASATLCETGGSANGQFYFTSVTVDYVIAGSSTPTISANNVNIAYNATSGSIAYTLQNATGNVSAEVTDGDWLTLGTITSTEVPFTCSANTGAARTATVTLSYTGATDKVVTVTQAVNPNLSNIAALTAQSAGNYSVSLTDALVTYVNGTNAYLEDASGAVMLYGCANGFAVGDKITGTANVTYTVFRSLPEVTAITLADGYTKTTGNTVAPTQVTIADLESNFTSYISRYVKIVRATVTSAFSNKNCTIEQSGSSIVLRDQNSSETLTTTEGSTVTVTAHPSIYNSTHQIAVYEQSQIVADKVDPTITFNDGSVRVGQTLDLSTLFTSNSDGVVNYSITAGDSYATLSSSTLTGTAVGSVTVKAEQVATNTYNAGEATATIIVNAALTLNSIAVTTAPSKTTYNEGETFDATGMVVTATYSDNSTEVVTGYTYSPNGALATSDTEITISYTENGVTKTATQTITVKEVVDYATLPFAFDGGQAAIENTNGLTQNGLGSDYNNSPKLKFDSTGDELVLKFNKRPGTLTFDIQGNGFSGGTFKVQTSEDGETYTDLKTYTELASSSSESFDDIDKNVRYIKWVYTEKVSGNVALGNIILDRKILKGDVNEDGEVTIADVTTLVNIILGKE